MKHLFLINPTAGKGDSIDQLVEQIKAAFSSEEEYEILRTEYAGHATKVIAERALIGEPMRIYACGGDGTLNEVVNGAAGHDHLAITHIPLGTGNDFLRMFGKDVDRFRSVAELKDGPQSAFDVMECNGQLGLDVICAGVDARVGADVHKYSGMFPGKMAYIVSMLVNVFLKDFALPLKVEINDEVWDRDTTILCVCNGRFYGGGFMPVGDAMPDDGILDVLLIPKISLISFVRLVGKYAKGHYKELAPLIRHFRTTRLKATSADPTTAVIDGEVIRDTVLDIRMSEKKVWFFYPEGAAYTVQNPR